MQPAPMDFDALVLRMKEAGAFTPYPSPLGKTDAASLGRHFKNPAFPGQQSYGNGPAVVEYSEIMLPHDLIRAQSVSMREGLSHYVPLAVMTDWTREFFSGNFLSSPAYKKLVSQLDTRGFRPLSHHTLDDSLTMQLDHPDRVRMDRKMFTEQEKDIAQDICRKVPQIAASVIAYQAAFVEYFNRLGKAVERCEQLSDTEKDAAREVITMLSESWQTENVTHNFIPAIALHYKKNHERIGESPTQQDFTQGMDFLLSKGAFGNKARHPVIGETRVFTCPARSILMDVAKVDLQGMPPLDGQPRSHEAGALLSQISDMAELQMRKGCIGQFTGMKSAAERDILACINRDPDRPR